MLQKQSLNVNFAQGVDTKTDPFQLTPGKFLSLNNSIFDVAGRLTKRNGFGPLAPLPDTSAGFLSTFNNNLTAIGSTLQAYSTSLDTWVNKGDLQPIKLDTLPIVKNNLNQTTVDSAIAPNGLICTVYSETTETGDAQYGYVISDSVTGQNIIPSTLLQSTTALAVYPKVVVLGNNFIIVYPFVTGPFDSDIRYIAVNTSNPTSVIGPTNLTSTMAPIGGDVYDIVVANGNMYLAYAASDISPFGVKVKYMTSALVQSNTASFPNITMETITIAADTSGSTTIIQVVGYDSSAGYVFAVDGDLTTLNPGTLWTTNPDIDTITAWAENGDCNIYYTVDNDYSYAAIPTYYIEKLSVPLSGPTTSASVVARSVGLASKAIKFNDKVYFLTAYDSEFQPSFFLMDEDGNIVAKLAYGNGGGYPRVLPQVVPVGNALRIPYLFKDIIQAANRTQGASSSGTFSQLGVGLATFTFTNDFLSVAEIGNNLHISGGFLWSYDGYKPVEHGFFVWPDDVQTTPATTGGSMADGTYFYQVTYEWTDNQGNLYRSAPSIPAQAVISGGSGNGSVELDIPTLRLTYKTDSPVRIVIYRWSAAQPIYYQVTGVAIPTLNDPSVDSITYTDTLANTTIAGNTILYTTGGVLENISPPATDVITLFNNRLWMLDSENRNLLWYSKQVIQDTPVEMSDLLTLYVAPTTSSEGSTGPVTAMAPMDDKLIIFKENALGYISGIGPDNAGGNNNYSEFTLINSVVGCINQQSIVIMPLGLMFQSNKGIWLVGRDLNTQYIGAPVEAYNSARVLAAVNIPQTNQIRFTLDNGITLMYDYYYNQWGTFTGIPAISSTIYDNLHTYIDQYGRVFQETPGQYLDNTSPVLMSFTTGWFNLAGVQGFQRFYQAYLLGTYLTPFKLNVSLSYDYSAGPSKAITVTPDNRYSTWGSNSVWGSGSTWGNTSNVFEARLFPEVQKCESFKLQVEEIYDASQGVAAGQGLTLTGMNLVVGLKKGYRTSTANKSFG